MLRLGKRGGPPETAPIEEETVEVANENGEQLNELFEMLKLYRDDLSGIPVSFDESDDRGAVV